MCNVTPPAWRAAKPSKREVEEAVARVVGAVSVAGGSVTRCPHAVAVGAPADSVAEAVDPARTNDLVDLIEAVERRERHGNALLAPVIGDKGLEVLAAAVFIPHPIVLGVVIRHGLIKQPYLSAYGDTRSLFKTCNLEKFDQFFDEFILSLGDHIQPPFRLTQHLNIFFVAQLGDSHSSIFLQLRFE